MGLKAEETLDLDYEELVNYIRSKTRVFMEIAGHDYYITHTDGYWRVQDCEVLNDKGRFTDCSELVTTVSDLERLDWFDGKDLRELYGQARFYASIQEGSPF